MKFTINDEYDGKKVLHFLKKEAGLSASLIKTLKETPNGVLFDGRHIRTMDLLKKGGVLTLEIPDSRSLIEPMEYPLDVIYEDEDVLVINKQAGLAMHPTHNHQGDTLANAVASYLSKKGKEAAFRSIGRLDKNTSGLCLAALHKHAAHLLSGRVEKTYFALVEGCFTFPGTIDAPICRPDPMKTLRAVGENGERAVTHYEPIATEPPSAGGNASFLKIRLETGRTHQIRVHFSHLGAPLLGDDMYGGPTDLITRHALHCGAIELHHPITKERMRFEAGLPEDMDRIIKGLTANLSYC
ncbi:MAG: RluA family pseudouridine synthase [Oscillospiraceae bacterium]|nr:RluA family pseudouridine synthase [Oscillospiraceae bacterium]